MRDSHHTSTVFSHCYTITNSVTFSDRQHMARALVLAAKPAFALPSLCRPCYTLHDKCNKQAFFACNYSTSRAGGFTSRMKNGRPFSRRLAREKLQVVVTTSRRLLDLSLSALHRLTIASTGSL
jgi:hypothetical protein